MMAEMDVMGLVALVAALWLGGWWLMQRGRRMRDARLIAWGRLVVEAAEQLAGENEEKLRFAVTALRKRFPFVSEDELRAVVEWAVYRLKAEEKAGEVGATAVLNTVSMMHDLYD